ncbi:lysostaphin resistance A-like protein [Candidatus Neomarinimicrobiota bacterium]
MMNTTLPDTEISTSPKTEATPEKSVRSWKRIFVNRFGHFRALWRMAIYIAAFFVLGIAINWLVSLIVGKDSEQEIFSWVFGLKLIARSLPFLLAALLVLNLVDRRPFALLGFHFRRGWLREMLLGMAIGFVLITLMVGILLVFGVVTLEVRSLFWSNLALLPVFLLLFVLAAWWEELFARGYLMQSLAEGSRPWIAAIIMSLPFTLGHLDNPNPSAMAMVNIFLLSLMVSVAYFKTRSLWLPLGLHFTWNWTQGSLWGFNVSGIEIGRSVFIANPQGSDLWTGGAFGAEGSLALAIIAALSVIWMWRTRWIRTSEANVKLWKSYPRGFNLPPQDSPDES